MKSIVIAASAAAALLGTMAVAAPASAQEARIRNAVARVVVIVEDRQDIGVEITPGSANLPAPTLTRRGNDIQIDGGLRNRFNNCNSGSPNASQPGEGATVEVRGVGRIRVTDAPLIVLRTPRAVDVSADGAVYGSVGRGASSIELGNGGCGVWTVANTSGKLDLSLGGSGAIRAGTSGELDASVGGSGAIFAGATGASDLSVGGSGGVTLSSVSGPSKIAIGGSGNVSIRGGDAPRVQVAIGGSGNVNFAGTVRDLSVSIAGSGDVRVANVTGNVSKSIVGSGNVTIGR